MHLPAPAVREQISWANGTLQILNRAFFRGRTIFLGAMAVELSQLLRSYLSTFVLGAALTARRRRFFY